MLQTLKVGDLLHCPRCRRWHPVMKWHTEGTDYTLRMLYFECKGQRFYAGQQDLESRHQTRRSAPATPVAESSPSVGKGVSEIPLDKQQA